MPKVTSRKVVRATPATPHPYLHRVLSRRMSDTHVSPELCFSAYFLHFLLESRGTGCLQSYQHQSGPGYPGHQIGQKMSISLLSKGLCLIQGLETSLAPPSRGEAGAAGSGHSPKFRARRRVKRDPFYASNRDEVPGPSRSINPEIY